MWSYKTTWLYGHLIYYMIIWLEPLKLRHHHAKFYGDVMILVCHVISQDHVIKESSKIMGITITPSCLAIGIVVVEI